MYLPFRILWKCVPMTQKVAVALLKKSCKMERQQQNTDSIHACSKNMENRKILNICMIYS